MKARSMMWRSLTANEHIIPSEPIDFEFEYPFGQKELYGLAYRTDFDLKNHVKMSGRLEVQG